MVQFEVIGRDVFRTPSDPVLRTRTFTVAGPFPTQIAAEQFRSREDPRGEISIGVRQIQEGRFAFEEPVVVGPKPSDRGRRLQRARQRRELATAAIRKIGAGEQVSRAEREAASRTRFITARGEKISGREALQQSTIRSRTFGIRTETRAEQVSRIRQATVVRKQAAVRRVPETPKDLPFITSLRPDAEPVLRRRAQITRAAAPTRETTFQARFRRTRELEQVLSFE